MAHGAVTKHRQKAGASRATGRINSRVHFDQRRGRRHPSSTSCNYSDFQADLTDMSFLETRVPPPLVAILSGLGITALAKRFPEYTHDVPHRRYVAGGITALSLVIQFKAVYDFRRHKTTLSPFSPSKASKVVRDGIFSVTRNPMYLSLCFVLAAWSVWKRAPLGAAMIAAFVGYITRFQIIPEERALRANFGEQYADYLKAVRRWI